MKKTPLSDRIRPDCEAAPWVCAEVKKLEERIVDLEQQLSDITEEKLMAEEYATMDSLARDQLLHFRFGPIWDGNLNSKTARDTLVDRGYLDRAKGFQFLTGKGIRLLVKIKMLNESTWNNKRPFAEVSK